MNKMVYQELYFSTLYNNSFDISPSIYCAAFKILECSFLQSWDLVNKSNDTIVFREDPGPTFTCRVPNGTYNVVDFCDVLSASMNASECQNTYEVEYSPSTRKLTILTTNPSPAAFRILGSTTASHLIGLLPGRDSEKSLGGELELPKLVNLSASAPLLLCSQYLQSEFTHYIGGRESNINVLACITPDSFGDIITYQSNSEFLRYGQNLSKMNFSLVDSTTMEEVDTQMTVKIGLYDDDADLVDI